MTLLLTAPPFMRQMGSGGNDAFTVLLMHCDGADNSTSFSDSSASGHTLTANGDAKITTANKVFGTGALTLGGANGFVSIPDSANWDFTGDFAIDLRVRPTSFGNTTLISNYAGAGSGWSIQINSGTTLRFGWGDTVVISATVSLSTNTWYHVAVTRSGSSVRLFLNGTQVGSTATSSTSFSGTTTQVRIGALPGVGQYFVGKMDEIRVSKGNARWTSNFTPPSAPYGP